MSYSNFFTPSKPIHLTIKQDRLRGIRSGFPWLYANSFTSLPPAPRGSLALVKDRDGTILAKAIYDPASHLAARILSNEKQPFTATTIQGRLQLSRTLRRCIIPKDTNCYRLINGEGDLLPGVVCDVYNSIAVLKFDGPGPLSFWQPSAFAEWLIQNLNLEGVYLKDRDDPKQSAVLVGNPDLSNIEVVEHGRKFLVNVEQGQKTGFFLDQRENRRLIADLAGGKRVLNLFGYTGGFSVYAGCAGAAHVTTVDISPGAIAAASANWHHNSLPAERHSALAADVFQFLETANSQKQLWDLVIVDPPSFAKNEDQINGALSSYRELLRLAIRVLRKDGLLAAASCTSRVTFDMFYEVIQDAVALAKRQARVLSILGQPPDHPFPLPCEDLRYLKFFLLQIN